MGFVFITQRNAEVGLVVEMEFRRPREVNIGLGVAPGKERLTGGEE